MLMNCIKLLPVFGHTRLLQYVGMSNRFDCINSAGPGMKVSEAFCSGSSLFEFNYKLAQVILGRQKPPTIIVK